MEGAATEVEPPGERAPSATPAARIPGPKGCLMAVALFGALGLGCILLAKAIFDRTNAGVIDGAKVLGVILEDAGREPGAAEVRALGCESAGVLSPQALRDLAARMAADEATKRGRRPGPVDVRATEDVVFCAHPADGPPTCAKVAETYVAAARPRGPFVVTVRTGYRERCSERFDAAGATQGEAPSPNLPLLVSPR